MYPTKCSTNKDIGGNSNSKGKGKSDLTTTAALGEMARMSGGLRDPKALEDMVQQVMRGLPRVQGLRGDEERAVEVEEALKKLDKGFDGGS